jgi:RNA recognition motif-containing protein
MDIFVGNLSFDETDQTLKVAFANHGEVASSRVVKYRNSGRSRRFAFVEMRNHTEARAAIAALRGTELSGRALIVNESASREGGGGGNRGRGSDRGSRW